MPLAMSIPLVVSVSSSGVVPPIPALSIGTAYTPGRAAWSGLLRLGKHHPHLEMRVIQAASGEDMRRGLGVTVRAVLHLYALRAPVLPFCELKSRESAKASADGLEQFGSRLGYDEWS